MRLADRFLTSGEEAQLKEVLIAADSILSLLHFRGLVDSEWNRTDVEIALDKVREFQWWYE